MWTRIPKLLLPDLFIGLFVFLFLGCARLTANFGYDLRETIIIIVVAALLIGFIRDTVRLRTVFTRGMMIIAVYSILGAAILGWSLAIFSSVLFVSFLLIICGGKARSVWKSKSRLKGTLVLLAFATVAIAVWTLEPLAAKKLENLFPYNLAPPFSMSKMDGNAVNSSDLKGHVVVLDFWATWCGPCTEQLPLIQRVYDRYEDNPNVLIWAVNLGDRDTPETIAGFFRQKRLSIPVVIDMRRSAAHRFSLIGIPYIVVLDKEGRIQASHLGLRGAQNVIADLPRRIDSLLSKP
jgi:thiol-disulfide isomerase/thioredoxin